MLKNLISKHLNEENHTRNPAFSQLPTSPIWALVAATKRLLLPGRYRRNALY